MGSQTELVGVGMSISVFDAARRLCERSGWRLTNLELQKLIYLAHMFYLGEHGKPLIRGHFEAWDYGPVQPDLYHSIKVYGASPVKSLLHSGTDSTPSEDRKSEIQMLDRAYDQLSHRTAGWLVSVTHWPKGAWAKHYDSVFRGEVIPNSDIIEEYQERMKNYENRKK